ncbi:MAG: hypothetical protein V4510_03120 [bacterium]
MRRLVAALAVVVLAAGCSSPAKFEVSRDRTTVDPHDAEEVNLQMHKDDTFDYSWTTTATLHFNIHSHRQVNGQTEAIEWVAKDSKGEAGTFKADLDGGYSLMWENTSNSRITLTYHASGVGTVDSRT